MKHTQQNTLGKLAAIWLLIALCSGIASAQTNSVDFKLPGGGDGGTVPTLDGRSIDWDADGNLVVTCADADADDFCDGIVGKSSGSGEGAASLNYFRQVGGGTELTIDENGSLTLTLEWQGDAATDLCLSSLTTTGVGATPTSWTERLAKSGTKSFTLGASTTEDLGYQFSMTCYNESGSDAATGTRIVSATVLTRETPVVEDDCPIIKGVGDGADPLFQPAGFNQHIVQWNELFYYKGSPSTQWEYPNAWGNMYPVGSWTMGNIGLSSSTSMKGRYISVPFVADTQSRSVYKLEWWQPIYRDDFPLYNPNGRQTDRFFITISPCAGDFRRATNSGNGPADGAALWSGCRKDGSESSISYGKNYCQLVHGKTYYMNMLWADPSDGLTPTETKCSNPSTGICEVMLYQR